METLRGVLKSVLFLWVWPLTIFLSALSDKWELEDLRRVGISFAIACCIVIGIVVVGLVVLCIMKHHARLMEDNKEETK